VLKSKKDAGDCDECGKFWEKMEHDKKNHVEELTKMIKNHLNEN